MTTATYETDNATELSTNRERYIRGKIDQVSYMPTSVSVAMRFIELGKDPDAGPDEYSRVIQSDASLSSKLLALANSAWFGVRNEVTQISKAVSLLGLANVRAVSISYCVTGLHHELNLGADVTHTYWEAALCKGPSIVPQQARRRRVRGGMDGPTAQVGEDDPR